MKAIFGMVAALLIWVPGSAVACSEPKIAIDIVAIHNPPSVQSDFSRKQLRDLAQQAHLAVKHEPLGFYYGKFGYTIDVRFSDRQSDCPGEIAIVLTMGLFDRYIDVASDIPEGSCLYREALAHYRRHAQADDLIFSRYARLVDLALHNTPSKKIIGENTAVTDSEKIKETIKSIVEQALVAYSADGAAAQDLIDAPDEVNRLMHGCKIDE